MELSSAVRIGEGRAAEVYAWGPGKVLKLFRADQLPEWVEREHAVGAAAHEAGLPAPRVFGLERVRARDGVRLGVVMERVDGPSLLQVLARQPWRLVEVARRLAEVQARVHAGRLAGLLPVQDRLRWWIARAELSEAVRRRAEEAVARMPVVDTVCHGDLHPDNVVLTARGPVVIDWSEASRGPPEADLVRTSLMLRHASPATGSLGAVVQLARWMLHGAWLRRYRAITGLPADALGPYLLPVAAARVGQAFPDEAAALRAVVEGEAAAAREGAAAA
jgi:aminoglycoside phosphotransferase (APT) family kinase protein